MIEISSEKYLLGSLDGFRIEILKLLKRAKYNDFEI